MESLLVTESKLDGLLKPDSNFDVLKRELVIGERKAVLYFIDGYTKDEIHEKIIEFYFKITAKELKSLVTADDFLLYKTPYTEAFSEYDVNKAATAVLAGQTVLIIDGMLGAVVTDTRSYPIRAIKEPEKDRSLRGSRDSFLETLIMNTAMLRRRIRDVNFRTVYVQVGESTKLDIAVCYIEGLADKKVVEKVTKALKEIDVKGISMTQEALSEKLVKKSFFNPLPRIKFTERPDFASAVIMEGKVVVIADNSPSVMIFPTSFFDFFKGTNDYYFPPLIGTYTRLISIFVTILMVYATPLYLLFYEHPELMPDAIKFLQITRPPNIPLFLQFVLLEFLIDGLKLASINTPDTLSGSLGIIGGLLLSDFTVTAGWFSLPPILLMAFVTIAAFSQPSYELSYTLKFKRILLLFLTKLFGIYGIIGSVICSFIVLLTTKTITGKGYLYPVIPFNLKKVFEIFIRTPMENEH